MVPLLLQADPLGLLPAAHSMVLLHLLHLLLLLTLQVLQLCVKELLLGLEGAEREIQGSHLIPGREMGKAQSLCSDLGLIPGLPPLCCVTWDKSLNLSESFFSCAKGRPDHLPRRVVARGSVKVTSPLEILLCDSEEHRDLHAMLCL